MERLLSAALLFTNVKLATLWFNIGTPEMSSTTIAGPNQEYVVQGAKLTYIAYTMDWGAGSTTSVKTITIPSNGNLNLNHARLQADDTFNCVTALHTIVRFNSQIGVSSNPEEYSVPTGSFYSYPVWIRGTNFIFIGTQSFPLADRKLYRLHSDRTSDVKTFTLQENTRAYTVLHGTGWLVISIGATAERKLYDFTNGYDGGTNSSVQTHIKSLISAEEGMFCPEDGRFMYIVGSKGSNHLFTVEGDGTTRLSHDLSVNLEFGDIYSAEWMKDSDLCVVAGWRHRYAIVNFMDLTTAPVFNVLSAMGSGALKPQVWLNYKAFMVPFTDSSITYVFEALTEMPCADLCGTCEGIIRKKCLTCVPHASLSGVNTCSCDPDAYEVIKSITRRECLPSSPFCGTCSAGLPTDCLTCRYSYMEM